LRANLIDDLAEMLTGDGTYFHAKPHGRASGSKSRPYRCGAVGAILAFL
jgi:hypothetical protein